MAAFAISALPLVEFSQTSALTLRSTKGMVASVLVAFAGQGALTWNHTVPVRASAEVAFVGQANLWHGRLRALVAHGEVVFTGVVHTCTLANGATVRDAVRSIVALWGQSSGSDDSPEVAEAVGFLNAAIQRLHESGKDYGFVRRVRRTYTETADQATPLLSVVLETDIQHVEGNVTFTKPAEIVADVEVFPAAETQLRPLPSADSLNSARRRFSGEAFRYENSEIRRPVAYFVRGDSESVVNPQLNIALAPAFEWISGTGSLEVTLAADVLLHSPRFSCCDVRNGARLPVPHRYAESLLIPLARYYALSSRYRVQESTVLLVKEQAQTALRLLGEVDPRQKDVQENRAKS